MWQTAETFGAIPSMSLTPNITHCVAATLGTEKTYRASKLGVPVVWQGWFWESVNLWERQDESLWLAMDPQANNNSKTEGGSTSNSANPTPGPSAPATPSPQPISLDGPDVEPTERQANDDGTEDADEDFLGDEHFGEGWDDDAQAELDAFLEGSSDVGSDAGTRYVSFDPGPCAPRTSGLERT